MVRTMIAFTILLVNVSVVQATPQLWHTLIFGGRKYAIPEIPMLGLWDYGGAGTGKKKPPPFEFQSTGNRAGYKAQFEIRDSKFYLKRIDGVIDGKKRKNQEII